MAKRDSKLTTRRNIAICKRFAYLTDKLAVRFDLAVKQMSENEFFLAEKTIYDILRKNSGKDLPELDLSLHLSYKRFNDITFHRVQ